MKHKQLIQDKLEHLKNHLRSLDSLYRVSSTQGQKNEVYGNILETVDEIITLVNHESED